ncbi:MAG: preprotein translocase subunit SecA [Patescibacteria group bacterium]
MRLLNIFGDPHTRLLKKISPQIKEINELESEIKKLSDSNLKDKTQDLKDMIKKGQSLEDILPEAFALVREVTKRTLGQRHYDVQLLGGIILHQGKIAEMRTGEGKTLVATLPAYLNTLEGRGVHIITVNDYLSRRDAVWMGQIYYFLGLSVGCINHEASYLYDPEYAKHPMLDEKTSDVDLDKERDEKGSFKVIHEFLRPCSRREAYEADITYGTNNEFGFDYLRDNLAYDKSQVSQREYNFAIVDEVDSILIDEARTPLIISAPYAESEDFYVTFSRIADKLKEGDDYTVDEKLKAISLTDNGIEKAEKMLGVENIYTEKGIKYVHHLETAVRAKALFHKDKDYVVKTGEVIIVDEFTGRLMPGRRWSDGLHQAIEAKEGVEIQKESRTFASVTFQNYFRMYKKLSGMTGTALTSAEEFFKVYNLETISIPTNKPMIRKDLQDLVFQTERGKFKAVVKKIKELNENGQPVLLGTASIEKNEYLSALLRKEGIPHKVLNAKNHEEEGGVIAQAGRKGMVTVATNMAGRGVDVVLGGNPLDSQESGQVRELGGLFVLGTERHEARRIDNQLRGRSGRQGDQGQTQFFVSLEDSLMRIFGPDRIKSMMQTFKIPEDQPIENKLVSKAIESAQAKIEGFNFDARNHLLKYDDVMNRHRNIIYERRKKILSGDNEYVWNALKDIFEKEGLDFSGVEKKRQEMGDELFFNTQRQLLLQVIDMLWVEHLEIMDYIRFSVRLRAYGQRDPLIEYKNESLRLFRELEASINEKIIEMTVKISSQSPVVSSQTKNIGNLELGIKNSSGKAGRNDPCPCGSGKKYKKCHGA